MRNDDASTSKEHFDMKVEQSSVKLVLGFVFAAVLLALCGCNAAKQAASTPVPPPVPPPTISLVGNWTGNIVGSGPPTSFSGSPIPFTLNVITSADGTIYFSWNTCDLSTNLSVVSGTGGQFIATGTNDPAVGLNGTESSDEHSINGTINFSLASCSANGAKSVTGSFSASKQ